MYVSPYVFVDRIWHLCRQICDHTGFWNFSPNRILFGCTCAFQIIIFMILDSATTRPYLTGVWLPLCNQRILDVDVVWFTCIPWLCISPLQHCHRLDAARCPLLVCSSLFVVLALRWVSGTQCPCPALCAVTLSKYCLILTSSISSLSFRVVLTLLVVVEVGLLYSNAEVGGWDSMSVSGTMCRGTFQILSNPHFLHFFIYI